MQPSITWDETKEARRRLWACWQARYVGFGAASLEAEAKEQLQKELTAISYLLQTDVIDEDSAAELYNECFRFAVNR